MLGNGRKSGGRIFCWRRTTADIFSLKAKKWWTRLRPIRTAGEFDLKIVIEPEILIPIYQKLSDKVKQLHVLGMSMPEIAKSLNIDPKTALRAYQH